MIKRKMLIATVAAGFILAGCGNRNVIGIGKQTYNYITCEDSYAPLKNAKIETWKDYEGEQIEVKIDGKYYLISMNKCYMSDKE